MPSGPKKRKAAKKKMESLAISTASQRGNGGSESEALSPMSPDHADRSDGRKDGGGDDGLSREVQSSQNGGGKAVDENQVIPKKAEEAISVPLVSESGTTLPVPQPEDQRVEQAETEKDVVVDRSGGEVTVAKEMLESSAPYVDGPTASTVDPVPTTSEKEVDARIGDVLVQKVEGLSSLEPTSVEKEGKADKLSCLQPSPSEEREEVTQDLASGELPSKEIEKKPESSCLLEPPSDEKEQGYASLSNDTSTTQPAESRVHHLQNPDEDIEKEGKVDKSRGLQPSPSEEREEKAQDLASGEPPSKEVEKKPESSCLQEPPSDEKEQEYASLSDGTSTRQSAESGVHRLQKVGEYIEKEGKVDKLSWLQPSPSEEREEEAQDLASGEPSSKEVEKKPESSCLQEPPSDEKEQEFAGLSDGTSTRHPAESGVHHLQKVGEYIEKEGKVDKLSWLQPSPSEEREEKAQYLASGEPPSKELEKKPESSCLQEPPSGEKEQEYNSFSDRTSTKQPAESGIHHLRKTDEHIGTEVILPPQVAWRTSRWSCCGLLDAFTSPDR